MLRKILRFILSEQVYSHLRKWRVLFLRLKAQALTNISFITYDFLNAIYAAYCKLNYKLRHVNHQSYYSKKLDLKLRTQLSEILDRTTKSQPLLLGRVPGHQSCDLIELVKGMEKFPLRFKRNFIYGPSPLQTLIRTAPFAHIESELGACPFYYNLQLLRIQKNKENKFQISGLDHITQGSHVGLKGFLVLGLTEMTYDISAQLKDRNTARFRKKTGDFIRITAPIIEMEFCSEGVIDSVDLLYIHALPSLNLIPICQQPGWDSIRPNLLWKSQIESVPQIEVPNKDELLNKISKGSFSGLNLGGGPHVYPRWVNIDTRYGIESTENQPEIRYKDRDDNAASAPIQLPRTTNVAPRPKKQIDVPTKEIWTVKRGDTLTAIARHYQPNKDGQKQLAKAILASNPQVKNPNLIELGQQLVIPELTALYAANAAPGSSDDSAAAAARVSQRGQKREQTPTKDDAPAVRYAKPAPADAEVSYKVKLSPTRNEGDSKGKGENDAYRGKGKQNSVDSDDKTAEMLELNEKISQLEEQMQALRVQLQTSQAPLVKAAPPASKPEAPAKPAAAPQPAVGTATQSGDGLPLWMLAPVGGVLLAGLGYLQWRRRNGT